MNRHIRLFVLLSAISSFLFLAGCSGTSVGVYSSYGYPYYGYGHSHTNIDIDVDIDRPNKPERPARPERPSKPPGNVGRPPTNRPAARPSRGGGRR